MKTLHTSTPWSYNRDKSGCQGHFITAAEIVICELEPPKGINRDDGNEIAAANARFIVLTCNAHEQLVAAAEYALDFLEMLGYCGAGATADSRLRKALAVAKGGALVSTKPLRLR